ncbi:DUF6216 family protein [Rhodoferax ferrireducens]|uniref:DUF6216 family protein n=1 Tax=Rhodoferax ferrireducens TaxID=192843 RepID=UPI003BB55335
MDLTAFSTLPSVLGILVSTFTLLGFGWLWWRTESRHVLMYRIWRLLHGRQPISDPEISAYIDEQTSLMSFRFLTGVQVKTLESARQLIQWAKFHDVEMKAISWCDDYFDPDLRRVRLKKLPPAWVQRLKIVFTSFTFLAAVIGSQGIVINDAVLKFKATSRWFLMNNEEAKAISLFNVGILHKSDCQANARDNALRTSFTESEVKLLCTKLENLDIQRYVQEIVKTQRLIFAFIAAVLLLITWHLFWNCMKGVAAKRLEKRCLNPEVTGGQCDLNFDEK